MYPPPFVCASVSLRICLSCVASPWVDFHVITLPASPLFGGSARQGGLRGETPLAATRRLFEQMRDDVGVAAVAYNILMEAEIRAGGSASGEKVRLAGLAASCGLNGLVWQRGFLAVWFRQLV